MGISAACKVPPFQTRGGKFGLTSFRKQFGDMHSKQTVFREDRPPDNFYAAGRVKAVTGRVRKASYVR
jgi:hypothetical protein